MRIMDHARRNSLKRIAAGSIAAATATALMTSSSSHANPGLYPSGISVKICDNPIGQIVILTNESDVTRTLKAIQPFKIYTKEGAVDLRQIFKQGDLRIPEHSTQTFHFSETGEVSRYARWRALVPTDKVVYPVAKLQPVDVISSVTGESVHSRNRQHLALFA